MEKINDKDRSQVMRNARKEWLRRDHFTRTYSAKIVTWADALKWAWKLLKQEREIQRAEEVRETLQKAQKGEFDNVQYLDFAML